MSSSGLMVWLINGYSMSAACCLVFKTMAYPNSLKPCIFIFRISICSSTLQEIQTHIYLEWVLFHLQENGWVAQKITKTTTSWGLRSLKVLQLQFCHVECWNIKQSGTHKTTYMNIWLWLKIINPQNGWFSY